MPGASGVDVIRQYPGTDRILRRKPIPKAPENLTRFQDESTGNHRARPMCHFF
jgi:hypothetical protein